MIANNIYDFDGVEQQIILERWVRRGLFRTYETEGVEVRLSRYGRVVKATD